MQGDSWTKDKPKLTRTRSPSTPLAAFSRFLTSENRLENVDNDFHNYGRMCFDFDNLQIFSNNDISLYGQAEAHRKPEDIRAILQLAAQKGHLPFFTACEKLKPEIIDETFLKMLIGIATASRQEGIADYLRSKYQVPLTQAIKLNR